MCQKEAQVISLTAPISNPYFGYQKKETTDPDYEIEIYNVFPGRNVRVEENNGTFLVNGPSFIVALNYYGCAHIEWEAINALGASWGEEKPQKGAEYTIGFTKIWLFFQGDANEAEITVKVRLHDATKEDYLGNEEIVHLKLVRQ